MGVVAVVVAALGCGGRGGSGDAGHLADAGTDGCSHMGCGASTGPHPWQVGFEVPIAAAIGDLVGSGLTACRNADCRAGTLATVSTGADQSSPITMEPGDLYLVSYVRAPGQSPTPLLEVGWGQTPTTDREIPDPQDGDLYSVELRAASGAVVAAASGVATYTVVTPNGPGCEPRCTTGTLTAPDAGTDQ
jgi:hypothetical protein